MQTGALYQASVERRRQVLFSMMYFFVSFGFFFDVASTLTKQFVEN